MFWLLSTPMLRASVNIPGPIPSSPNWSATLAKALAESPVRAQIEQTAVQVGDGTDRYVIDGSSRHLLDRWRHADGAVPRHDHAASYLLSAGGDT
jgi:hypothetical protein